MIEVNFVSWNILMHHSPAKTISKLDNGDRNKHISYAVQQKHKIRWCCIGRLHPHITKFVWKIMNTCLSISFPIQQNHIKSLGTANEKMQETRRKKQQPQRGQTVTTAPWNKCAPLPPSISSMPFQNTHNNEKQSVHTNNWDTHTVLCWIGAHALSEPHFTFWEKIDSWTWGSYSFEFHGNNLEETVHAKRL